MQLVDIEIAGTHSYSICLARRLNLAAKLVAARFGSTALVSGKLTLIVDERHRQATRLAGWLAGWLLGRPFQSSGRWLNQI